MKTFPAFSVFRVTTLSALVALASAAMTGCATAPNTRDTNGPEAATAPMPEALARTTTGSNDTNIIFGAPKTGQTVQKLVNVGYTSGYSAETRTPLWVSYRLFEVGSHVGPPRPKPEPFAADPRVDNPVKNSDYQGSGYDRGHMAPSAPIGKHYGKAAQEKTFLMTNMVPQVPGLNQRGWQQLEDLISSDWAERFHELWVITGPIFQGPCKELESGVKVPSECYMVIVRRDSQNRVKALGVIMPQRRINDEILRDFVVSVDEIERRTNIDFLSDLPDEIEAVVEAAGKDAADPEWHIETQLKPTFPAPARPIVVRDCN